MVITAATTGQDLIDVLSVEERECIRSAYGDAVYDLMLQLPLAEGTVNPTASQPLYNCLTTENVLHVGIAFVSFVEGGWSSETIACNIETVRQYPSLVSSLFGIEFPADAAQDAATDEHPLVVLYKCQNENERAHAFARNQILLDTFINFEYGLLSLLPQQELDCIQSGLTGEEYAALSQHSLLSAFESPSGATLAGCISDESFSKSFMVIVNIMLLGNMSGDTRTCLLDFAGRNPDYVGAAKLGYYDFEKIPVEEYVAIADAQFGIYDCLSDEELDVMLDNSVRAALGM